MPSSFDNEPFIPPSPNHYGEQPGVIPSPMSESASVDNYPDRPSYPSYMPRRGHPRGPNPYPGYPHFTPPGPGWTPPGGYPGPQYGPPPGYPPYATPHRSHRAHGHTPGQPPYPVYGGTPWMGYPPPPGHGGPPPTGPYGPGLLPHDPRAYGPTPYPPYQPMDVTPFPYGWTPTGPSPVLYQDDTGLPFPPPERPKEDMIRVGKWEVGNNYGPVLTPFLVAILDVTLHVNPLLAPGNDHSPEPYLVYNLLFPSNTARRSCDPLSRSWASGRSAPATWPRVSHLRIISHEFPWVFEIEAQRAERGVTCLDVVEGLYEQLQAIVPRSHIESLTGAKGETHRRRLYEAYYYNRSTARDAPGGSLGEGVRRIDWLLNHVMFDGLVNDKKYVQEKLGITGPGWKGLQKKNKPDKDKDKDKDKDTPKDKLQSWPATLVLKLDMRYSDVEVDRASTVTDATDQEASEASVAG